MNKERMLAFSDGVIAVIITIMVLDLKAPTASSLASLRPVAPLFLTYVLSYVYVAIYWNNHHHLMQAAEQVNGRILWANMHLLFWLSLTPFATAWLGHYPNASWPVALYGLILLFAAVAYTILTRALIAHHGAESKLSASIGSDAKGWASLAIYAIALPIAFVRPWIANFCYFAVALIWLVPDPRIERRLQQQTD